jgi:hypothetical protein
MTKNQILSNSPLDVININYYYVSAISIPLVPNPATGSSIYGTLTYYPFEFPLGDGTLDLFTIRGSGLETQTFESLSEIFIVPSMTAIMGTLVNLTMASMVGLTSLTFKVVVSVLVPQNGTQSLRIKEFSVEATLLPPPFLTLYALFGGSIEFGCPLLGW